MFEHKQSSAINTQRNILVDQYPNVKFYGKSRATHLQANEILCDRNTVCEFAGDRNTLCEFAGDRNTLCEFAGNRNTVYEFAGDRNTVYEFAGDRNTVCEFAGDRSTGCEVNSHFRCLQTHPTTARFCLLQVSK